MPAAAMRRSTPGAPPRVGLHARPQHRPPLRQRRLVATSAPPGARLHRCRSGRQRSEPQWRRRGQESGARCCCRRALAQRCRPSRVQPRAAQAARYGRYARDVRLGALTWVVLAPQERLLHVGVGQRLLAGAGQHDRALPAHSRDGRCAATGAGSARPAARRCRSCSPPRSARNTSWVTMGIRPSDGASRMISRYSAISAQGDRQHLLLAAAHRAASPVAPLGEPREEGEGLFDQGRDLAALLDGPRAAGSPSPSSAGEDQSGPRAPA